MRRTDVIVIGGGQAGLAASYGLSARGIDHAVLERGRLGERWRSATWDSLHLQTPRWQSRLPGWQYRGDDPHGYMAMSELVAFLEGYARSFRAPVHEGVTVRAVTRTHAGYAIDTDAGTWRARAVILATGHCDVPAIPRVASAVSPHVHQLAATAYRRPAALPPGGVLVVGASASGALIADELRRAGRDVTLAVGNHTRLPRHHRGRDIYYWLDAMGVLEDGVRDVRDLAAARGQPSMQLAGDPTWRSIDLATLQAAGVRLAGRLVGTSSEAATFADDLAATMAAVDARATAIVDRIDAFASAWEIDTTGPAARIAAVDVARAPTHLTFADERIATIVWATGYRRDYRWLQVPGVVAGGELVHDQGVTPAPDLYALGLRFMRRRNSSFLDGVGADAAVIVDHLAHRFERRDAA